MSGLCGRIPGVTGYVQVFEAKWVEILRVRLQRHGLIVRNDDDGAHRGALVILIVVSDWIIVWEAHR